MISIQKLNEKQKFAYNLMSKGKNVFLTGAGGVGKSLVIKTFVKIHKPTKKIAVTSTTGTSAILINGVTLHSYLGIGIGKGTVDFIYSKISENKFLKKKWNKLDILIIDEISMLSPELFDKLEEIARKIRKNNKPFGGIQLILSGDFLQLPCIDSTDFCYSANSWSHCIDNVIYLDEIIRQNDIVFQNFLKNIRIGHLSNDIIDILESRVNVDLINEFGIQPTKLYPLNFNVDIINEDSLEKLATEDTEFFEYEMEIKTNNTNIPQYILNKIKKDCTAPEILQLCVNAQVILLCNIDLESKLANGCRGIVSEFRNDLPVVKFLNGVERVIDYYSWDIDIPEINTITVTQIPLKLAFAVSIHKIQGCTLDFVEIDLTNVFEYGQAYTALSRVKNLQGLKIIGYDINKIKSHPKAIEFYNNL